MTNFLIIIVIYILLFGTDKFKQKARPALTVILGIILVLFTLGTIYRIPNYFIGNSSDFLLVVVIYILLFGAEKFKDKNKIIILTVLGIIALCYSLSILINIKNTVAAGDWKGLFDGIGLLLGVFLIAHMINTLLKKK